MRDTRPRLDARQIDFLFAQLRLVYGLAFERQWSPPPDMRQDEAAEWLADLKAHWAVELGLWAARPAALRWALENLPETPPSLIAFRGLCARCPDVGAGLPELPAPDPARAAQVITAVREAAQRPEALPGAKRSGREWAWRLRSRELAGDRLHLAQRRFWREALGLPPGHDPRTERGDQTVQAPPGGAH